VESLNVVVTVSELAPGCSPVSPVIIEVDPEGATRETVTESLLEGTSKTMPLKAAVPFIEKLKALLAFASVRN